MRTKLTAYIEYGSTFGYDDMKENMKKKILEIVESQKDIIFPLEFFEYVHPSIEEISYSKLPADHELIVNVKNKKYTMPPGNRIEHLLALSIEVEVPSQVHENFVELVMKEDEHFFDNMDLEEVNKTLIEMQFEKRIYDLIIAANLSSPATLQIASGIIIQDGNRVGNLRRMSCITMYKAMEFNKRINYPKIKEIEFITVWKWILERKDFLAGFSEGKTGRALNCFSYILNGHRLYENDDASVLFRSIMGIEALYTKGTSSLQEQVREKSQLILGAQDSFKKVYSSMYNFRSRFVHGDLDFPVQYNTDFTNKIAVYTQEFEQANYYSITLLTASLQELIVRNWTGFEFNYTVEDSEEK